MIYERRINFLRAQGIYFEALKMAILARSVLPDPVPVDLIVVIQNQVALYDVCVARKVAALV
jgi:hypothetical protein